MATNNFKHSPPIKISLDTRHQPGKVLEGYEVSSLIVVVLRETYRLLVLAPFELIACSAALPHADPSIYQLRDPIPPSSGGSTTTAAAVGEVLLLGSRRCSESHLKYLIGGGHCPCCFDRTQWYHALSLGYLLFNIYKPTFHFPF